MEVPSTMKISAVTVPVDGAGHRRDGAAVEECFAKFCAGVALESSRREDRVEFVRWSAEPGTVYGGKGKYEER